MLARIFRDIDYVMVVFSLCLIGMGITVVYSLTAEAAQYSGFWSRPWQRQVVFAAIGLVIMFIVSGIDYRKLMLFAPFIYATCLGLLIATAVYGVERHGAQSWLYIPGVPLQLQTSEFAKIGVIAVLVRFLSRFDGKINTLFQLIPLIPLVLIPMFLVLKQPDLGTALVFMPITVGLLVLGGLAWPLVGLMLSPALALLAIAAQTMSPGWVYALTWLVATVGIFVWAWRAGALRTEVILITLVNIGLFVGLTLFWAQAWDMLEPHQQNRIRVFTDPDFDPTGAGWQVEQSKIAIGSGGLVGKGVGQGTQSHLKFLAETPTDFVFSVLAEEWGFIGGVALLAAFGLLLWRGIGVAMMAGTLEGSLLACGVVLLFFTHVLINVGMTMGLMPVTGLPLPFISYGGSALLTNLICIGLVMSVYRYRHEN